MTMQQYVQDGTLRTLPAGVVLTGALGPRLLPAPRIVLSVDLEAYEYYRPVPHRSSARLKRRLSSVFRPRLKVRQGACLELPHIMILIDDPDCQIIEPPFEQTASYDKLYDTDLMQNGGHITGWFLPERSGDRGHRGQSTLRPRDLQQEALYRTPAAGAAAVCAGDGNHSMATCKGVPGKRSRRA